MRKTLTSLALTLLLAVAGQAYALTAAPQNVSTTPWSLSGPTLSWDDTTSTASVYQWFIYINGLQLFSPTRSQIQGPTAGRVGYVLTGIAESSLPVTVTVKALGPDGLSAFSTPVQVLSPGGGGSGMAVTQGGPFTMTALQGTSPWVVSGGGGGPVTQGSPWTVSGSVAVTNNQGLTITTSAGTPLYISPAASGLFGGNGTVSQGSPWTVSGSVAVTNNQGLSVTASQGSPWTVSGSVAVTNNQGLTVTASQGSPWTVSGSVAVTNLSSVTITSMPAVTQGSPWTVSGSVGVTSGVAGISVTASQGSPWTVSGSVSVTNLSSLTITSMPAVTQGSPWTVSGSVGVTSGMAGISVTASQGAAYWGVTVTSMPSGVTVNTHAVTQGSAWTVSGSVQVQAGTNYMGAVNISNTAGAPVFVSPAASGLFGGSSATNITLSAIADGLSTTLSASSRALNSAITADYDANTLPANGSRKFNTTVNYYYQTTGTTTVTAGYNALYSVLVYPASVSGSVVTLFDGAVTRATLSGNTVFTKDWMRGQAYTTNMTIRITGTTYDGGVSLEAAQ